MDGWRRAAVLLAWLAFPAVLVAAYMLLRFLVPDGVAAFEGNDRWRAKLALIWAEADLDDTPEELIATAYRVEEVGPCDGPRHRPARSTLPPGYPCNARTEGGGVARGAAGGASRCPGQRARGILDVPGEVLHHLRHPLRREIAGLR